MVVADQQRGHLGHSTGHCSTHLDNPADVGLHNILRLAGTGYSRLHCSNHYFRSAWYMITSREYVRFIVVAVSTVLRLLVLLMLVVITLVVLVLIVRVRPLRVLTVALFVMPSLRRSRHNEGYLGSLLTGDM